MNLTSLDEIEALVRRRASDVEAAEHRKSDAEAVLVKAKEDVRAAQALMAEAVVALAQRVRSIPGTSPFWFF